LAKTKETTALATAEETQALATPMSFDLEADAQQYVDDYQQNDFAIPFLQIIQSNSPQLDESSAKYIDGAKMGDIFNTVSKTFYRGKTGVTVIPAHYVRAFIEWRLRTEGGGFVKNHGNTADAVKLLNSCEKDEKGALIVPGSDGRHQLVETMQFAVLQLDAVEDQDLPALIAMTSTQLKKGRGWNSTIDGVRIVGKNGKFRPPMFSQAYKLTTVQEENKKGKYYGWLIETVGPVLELPKGEQRYLLARSLRESIERGTVDTDKSHAAAAEASGASTDDGVPF
jgi:hypothetical protein